MADLISSRSGPGIGPVIASIPSAAPPLGLVVGDWVEVRPIEEILATLDARGCLDALPFMPEMACYCGRRFQVFRTAHKTCDVVTYKSRRMERAVHLTGLRCDGSGHDGCQAHCLIFWKEAWLKRVDGPAPASADAGAGGKTPATQQALDLLGRTARLAAEGAAEPRYRCQATETVPATTPLPWWDVRQYVEDVARGNLTLRDLLSTFAIHLLRAAQKLLRLNPYPSLRSLAGDPLPAERLDLQPGELVEIRSKAEIMATLGRRLSNRGLSFDVEMARLCGRTFRVLRRIERIIDENTGRMLKMRHDCIMLEGAVCSGIMSGSRVGCPKAVPFFWREIWLRRVTPNTAAAKAPAPRVAARAPSPAKEPAASLWTNPHRSGR